MHHFDDLQDRLLHHFPLKLGTVPIEIPRRNCCNLIPVLPKSTYPCRSHGASPRREVRSSPQQEELAYAKASRDNPNCRCRRGRRYSRRRFSSRGSRRRTDRKTKRAKAPATATAVIAAIIIRVFMSSFLSSFFLDRIYRIYKIKRPLLFNPVNLVNPV